MTMNRGTGVCAWQSSIRNALVPGAIASDPRFAAYRLVRALSPGGQLYGRPYYELVFLRGDLVPEGRVVGAQP
jgi:hypothetical protein